NKADNIDKAIAFFEAALEVYTRKDFPQNWAITQLGFGNAYLKRIKGNKADNIDKAIAAYNAALEVCTRKDFPQDWATIQNNLGLAYWERIKGNKADNIDKAIAAYNAALKVCTRKDFPQDWARTQNNLGNAYTIRIKGNKADNIDKAIAAYNAALEVCTRKDFPQNWADTQNNLGNAYFYRIKGDKADNIDKAIAFLEAALEVYTRNELPQNRADTQNNLGFAYTNRIKGDKADNIEKAIAFLEAALEVYTRYDFPQDWANTHNNLGAAYFYRIKGDKEDNFEKAIAAYNAALEVYTRYDFPQDWAKTQNNFGNAYTIRIKGDKEDNIEKAIAAYNAALEVYTRYDFPQDWADTQNNLGAAYFYRIKGDKEDNIKKAITFLKAALEIRTPTALPIECLTTAGNLGNLLFEIERWQESINAYDKAIQAVELSRSWATDNTRRQEILENAINVYINIVQACINNEQPEKAIEYAERSKARNLVELVYDSQLEPKGNIPQKQQLINEFKLLRRQIKDEQRFLNSQAKGLNTNKDEYQRQAENEQLEESRQRLEQLQQQLDELLETKIQPYDPSFSLTQKVEPIQFNKIQSLLDKNTAIIEWYLTKDKITAFLITPKPPILFFGRRGGSINIWQSKSEDLEALIDWVNEYLGEYYNGDDEKNEQWQKQLEHRLKKLAEILHIDEIVAQIPKECDRLIIIPHRFLHILPFHALEVKNSESSINKCLLELFPRGVSYAPSCQLLQLAQNQQQNDFTSLFAIQTPTEDLYKKDLGAVQAIKKQFTDSYISDGANAKKSSIITDEKLIKANCVFFFCHGYFEPKSPLDSGLILADDKLTLGDLFTQLKLENCRLVTLSACETGLIDFNNTSDEYIGLPSGFIFAGSTNVVSSLWTVNAAATALLMIKFYEELQQQNSIVLSLNKAQLWLRDTTIKGFQGWLKNSLLSEEWQKKLNNSFTKIEANKGAMNKPFESPYFWSAFCAIGKGE
ncbi:MAG: CHAT domain-containing tetratricopeptide repeat protein, partial [Cyanobacteria bacterium P01_H01_bin.150]